MKIQKGLPIIKLSFFIALLLHMTSCSDDENTSPAQDDLASILTKHLDQNQSTADPGLSILIRHQRKVIYQNSIGIARLEGNRKIDAHTGFRIASVTKPITAIGIMILVEQSLISLDTKLLDVLPDLPSSFEKITIENLLSHRSGLLDYIDDNDDLETLDGLTVAQIPLLIPESGLNNLLFEPGSDGEYSNTGYVLLAMVIEKIAKMDYPTFVKTKIFEPANMLNSFVINENMHLGDLNDNYALSFGTSLRVLGFNSLIYGANGIVSSTHDLGLFVEALLNNEIISEQSLDSMVEVQGPLDAIADYGYGWMTGKGQYEHTGVFTDPNDFWHTGGFDGYRSLLSINPEMDLQVIVLTNNGDKTQQLEFDVLRLTRDYLKNN